MTHYTRSVRGFTAMEMLFVIAIISILAGIVLGNLWGATDDSKAKKAEVDLKQMQLAMRLYVEQGYSSYPPGVDNCSECQLRGNSPNIEAARTTWNIVIDSTDLLSDAYRVDPWGNPYAYDNNLNVAAQTLWTTLCSMGPNGVYETTESAQDKLDNYTKNDPSGTYPNNPNPQAKGDDICIFF